MTRGGAEPALSRLVEVHRGVGTSPVPRYLLQQRCSKSLRLVGRPPCSVIMIRHHTAGNNGNPEAVSRQLLLRIHSACHAN